MPHIYSEAQAIYLDADDNASREEAILKEARAILKRRLEKRTPKDVAKSPEFTKEYLQMKYALEEREIFSLLFLSTKNGILAEEVLFTGTLNSSEVHPREVVKAALKHNAAAVILCHNHPSGEAKPSEADELITDRLRSALETVDIRMLDHIIVGRDIYSFAENGFFC